MEGETGSSQDGEAKKKEKGPAHALFLAHHFRGHLAPALYLSMELARRGIIVSFVSFDVETSSLIAERKAELAGLDLLRFLPLSRPPQLPSAVQNNFLSSDERWKLEVDMLLKSFKDSQHIKDLFGGTEPPTCMIICMFLWQSKQLDLDLRIPRYSFQGAGAILARFNQALEDLFSEGHLRIRHDDHRLEKFDGQIDIAGLPGLTFNDLPRPLAIEKPAFLREFARSIMGDADGILINTYNDLEPRAMEALQKFRAHENQKFYAIGPVDPLLAGNKASESAKSEKLNAKYFHWLDSQPAASVIYICFGSLHRLTPGQTKELAIGLLKSKRRFLWVLPKSSNSHEDSIPDFLPPAFEKQVAEFGYILKGWVPQVEVLSHPSIGVFFSHCGWNSCLEAISNGVPMIASPLGAEQHLNSRYLVNELRIAAEVRWNPDDISELNSVEGVIRLVMEGKEGRVMKSRVKALQSSLAVALAVNGSTIRKRDELVEDIKAL